MKKTLCIFLAILFVVTVSGCKQENPGTPVQSLQTNDTKHLFPLDLYFTKGISGYLNILLGQDGGFSGEYYHADFQNTDPSFPGGTIMECRFTGTFQNLKQLNAYSYSLEFKEIVPSQPAETVYINNDTRYIVTIPSGLAMESTFILYTPETPIKALPDGCEAALPYSVLQDDDTLNVFFLYNEQTGQGYCTK